MPPQNYRRLAEMKKNQGHAASSSVHAVAAIEFAAGDSGLEAQRGRLPQAASIAGPFPAADQAEAAHDSLPGLLACRGRGFDEASQQRPPKIKTPSAPLGIRDGESFGWHKVKKEAPSRRGRCRDVHQHKGWRLTMSPIGPARTRSALQVA
ncbi:hypothetical protein DCS_04294 [Drechmeria coniospora]|uniref:Uncharacterized protein n=1 Tax=Drechmeria coniospora TaxID=98403 RepID=A0A151GJL3_DRECN|nr:hypothetical protein DCS_04294 [Drechmeria coniospora]KYK57287.1 hypothetical protein DCS_04294 [Drechmeria coniospora]